MLAEAPYGSPSNPPFAAALPSTTATALKRQGWPSIMVNVRKEGHLLITNHNLPEAVILPPEEYDKLVDAAQKNAVLPNPEIEALKLKFRERLKCLQETGANETLANLMSSYPKLNGQVIAGATY